MDEKKRFWIQRKKSWMDCLLNRIEKNKDEKDEIQLEFKKRGSHRKPERIRIISDVLKTLLILILSTLICMSFRCLGFSEANLITVYILGVLIIAVTTNRRIYSLLASTISVLSFNYFFTSPYLSLKAYDDGYPMTFIIMFISAFITSSLAVQLKKRSQEAAEAAYRTKILLETNQLIQKEKDRQAIVKVVIHQLSKLLNRTVLVYLTEKGKLNKMAIFSCDDCLIDEHYVSEEEMKAVKWSFEHNHYCGAGTQVYSQARCLYLTIRVEAHVYGVLGILIEGDRLLDSFESDLVYAILGECALALQNEESIQEREESRVLAQNEQLRANLLRSISHDLRTPLTSISGNASILLSNGKMMEEDHLNKLYLDIYDDAMWLVDLVENLLAITRIDGGSVDMNFGVELLDDIVTEAMKHLDRKKSEHVITVHQKDEFILVRADVRLMVQVVTNLVNNAIKYTPPHSHIDITLFKENGEAVVDVADDGEGIPDQAKEKIFEMFYTLNNELADSRRSMGLGLSLCKSIIGVHHGRIKVFDNKPKGTVFRFVLPEEEVRLRE